MKCDICGQDVGNSEALETHKERMHPAGEGDQPADALEKPDLLGDTVEESSAAEIPKPTY
jgi:hypothetical protein